MSKEKSRVDILGLGFDNVSKDEALNYAFSKIPEHRAAYVVTPNPEIVMQSRKDEEMHSAIEASDLVIADGVGVIIGAKILGRPLKERIPGIDFTTALFEKMAIEGMSVFLFGAKPGIAELAAEKISEKYPGLIIAGTNDGYFTEDKPIVEKINAAAPDLLLVCLGAPKQEKWMRHHREELNVGLMIGAGGSLDVFSGTVERAPFGWRKLGLEWLHRLIKDPRRIKRMINLPKFIFAVIISRIRG